MTPTFLVGPGCVGKTTVGALLAALTATRFVDLDRRFCDQVGFVPTFIREHGYREYCEANAALAAAIVNHEGDGLVLATSSGFLVHDGCEDIVERNLALIRRNGVSVYLRPSHDHDTAARTLAFRQVRRYPERDLVAEFTIAHSRCGRYLAASDHIVDADAPPFEVANRTAIQLMLPSADLAGPAVRAPAQAPGSPR